MAGACPERKLTPGESCRLTFALKQPPQCSRNKLSRISNLGEDSRAYDESILKMPLELSFMAS